MDRQLACAIITPAGRAAVTSICVWGEQSADAMQRFFCSRYGEQDLPIDRIVIGRWRHDRPPGEQVVVSRRDTKTFEVHCHGGLTAAAVIVESLQHVGAEQVRWREVPWLRQQSRLRQEAVQAMSQATTELAVEHLAAQLGGALDRRLVEIIACLHQPDSSGAAGLIDQLIATASSGLHLVEPFQVAICGPPNVGKSRLLNAVVGFQRSIVYDQPGTTRDVLTVDTAIDGWPVRFHDTAGLRDTDDLLESEGIQRALRAAALVQLIVLVFDVNLPWQPGWHQWIDRFPAALVVHNKADLAFASGHRPAGLHVSALSGNGVELLLEQVAARLCPGAPSVGDPIVFTQRQQMLLLQARAALNNKQPAAARQLLDSIR